MRLIDKSLYLFHAKRAEEVRMGQFVSDYIQRSFFFDIHPPVNNDRIATVMIRTILMIYFIMTISSVSC
jgi:dolichyl-phosphate-mannose--protein O-mannosyl transferase